MTYLPPHKCSFVSFVICSCSIPTHLPEPYSHAGKQRLFSITFRGCIIWFIGFLGSLWFFCEIAVVPSFSLFFFLWLSFPWFPLGNTKRGLPDTATDDRAFQPSTSSWPAASCSSLGEACNRWLPSGSKGTSPRNGDFCHLF